VGVVAAIKPWNLPLQTPMFTVGRALAAGNSVILKPSEYSSLAALEMEKAFQKAGLPAGVMQVLVGGKDTGMELVKADVDMVSFTGSVAAGRDIARVCGDKLIKASLELGGKDPLIIWNDVDLDFAARGTVYGAFTNCGQFCSSVERVYVHEDIYSEMTQKIVAVVKKLTLGFGSDDNTDIGPLATKDQLMIVQNHVKDAVAGGAKLLCGGKVPSDSKLGNGFFFEPTVLTGVSHEMQIMTEETFGPVCPIMPFRDEDEAITLANDSKYGLAAAVFAQDEELVDRMASRLDAGMVWINESHITMPGSPWIARKDSGMGMKLGKMGLLEYTQPKLINKQISNNSECRPWWFQLD
jgi:acyl-CoA reductase-like NAD-dependent aldehyde dehydrogenase